MSGYIFSARSTERLCHGLGCRQSEKWWSCLIVRAEVRNQSQGSEPESIAGARCRNRDLEQSRREGTKNKAGIRSQARRQDPE